MGVSFRKGGGELWKRRILRERNLSQFDMMWLVPKLVVDRASVRFEGSLRSGLPSQTEPNRLCTERILFGNF
jgi:hypothetical protein